MECEELILTSQGGRFQSRLCAQHVSRWPLRKEGILTQTKTNRGRETGEEKILSASYVAYGDFPDIHVIVSENLQDFELTDCA